MLESLHAFLQKRPAAGGAPPAYSIARSLRFNSADSAYLSRTPGGAGTRTKWTWSGWVKRAAFGATQSIFGCGTGSSDTDYLYLAFNSSDQIIVSGGTTAFRATSAVYRDPSAHYHIVLAVDTTQGTANNRIRLYVNGSEVTAFGTTNNPSSSANTGVNQAAAHYHGRRDTSDYANMYLSEVHFCDGTQYAASDFGETNSTTGQWVPKAPSVTYGTNGFWLSFYDNTSTTTVARDDAGGAAGAAAGANDWTASGISVTSGVGNDSLTDTPTNNYPTLNPLWKSSNATQSNGNLTATTSTAASETNVTATVPFPTSGKWVMEVTPNAATFSGNAGPAIVPITADITGNTVPGSATNGIQYLSGGTKQVNGSNSAYGSSWTTNDVLRVEVDMDGQTVQFFKNGTGQGTIALTAGVQYMFAFDLRASSGTPGIDVNFGQRAFAGTPTTGFSALCTSNLPTPPIPKSSAQFDVALWTGDGSSSRSITGLNFQPDLVWTKNRDATLNHALFDSVRGVGASKALYSSSAWGEAHDGTNGANATYGYISSLDSAGFSLVAGSGVATTSYTNKNTIKYVGWSWKKGVTPGFDIVSYTGNGSNRTISHALGVAPRLMLVKKLSAASSAGWMVYHADRGNTGNLYLNTTNAFVTDSTVWNNTSPTSSVFSIGTHTDVNANTQTHVAYLFAEVAGFSRFGSYTGNGSSDGVFVHCGFRPRFIMVKRTDTTGGWYIYDTARFTYNAMDNWLQPNSSGAESTGSLSMDILSNGFKPRSTNTDINASGGTYVFAAFAEFPFKYSNAR